MKRSKKVLPAVAAICGTMMAAGGLPGLQATLAAQPPAPPPPSSTPEGTPRLPETVIPGGAAPAPEVDDVFAPPPPSTQADEPIWTPGGLNRFSSPPIDGYRAESSTAGGIIDIPDVRFPGTVNVVSSDVIRDQQALNFQDVARDAGATVAGGDALFADRFFLRGFELNSRDFRKDGFLDPTYVPRDFANIDRIEILKGPASVLYGAGSPVGMVNLITKKPLDADFAYFTATLGSFERQRYTIDANGAADESRSLLFRINVAHEDTNTFVDYNFLSRTMVAPTLRWRIDDDATLTWLSEIHRDHRTPNQGVPVFNGSAVGLPPNRYVGQPANDFIHFEEYRNTLMLTRAINDDWTLNIGGSSLFYRFPGSSTGVTPPLGGPFFLQSRTDIPKESEQSQSFITNLAGDVEILGMRHQLLTGLEYNYFDSNAVFNSGVLPVPFDVSNPTYTNPPATPVFGSNFPVYRQQRVGGYLQDLVQVTDELSLLAGVRFDSLALDFERQLVLGGFPLPVTETNQTYHRATPRVGVVYQPWADDALAFYFNYSQSFAPPGGGIYQNTTTIKPITGEGWEGGIKSTLADGLTLDVAGFYATRDDVDLSTSSFFLVQVGEERSQGAEINLLGRISETSSIVANYAYTDSRLQDASLGLNGVQQRNVPYNSANVWFRNNVVQSSERTIGWAFGLVHLDPRAGDLANTFQLPGYTRWDGGLFYTQGLLSANLYAENLFDVNYAQSSINSNQVFLGAPANVRLQVGWLY